MLSTMKWWGAARSIHDAEVELEKERGPQLLAGGLSDSLFLVARAYFENPRATADWKGLINDPDLDRGFRVIIATLAVERLNDSG